MDTLIELYDERPIENVLASEVFRPQRTVFLCPSEIAQNKQIKSKLCAYFRHRGLETELIFVESSLLSAEKIEKQLRKISSEYPGCVVDITGGSESALFACGAVCSELNIPAFTYSRKSGCFYNVVGADFADRLTCTLTHTVEDCFLMAGGSLRQGRVDNKVLSKYADTFDAFFKIYLDNRSDWTRAVSYLQSVSQNKNGQKMSLKVDSPLSVKAEQGRYVPAPVKILAALEKIGYVKNLAIGTERVSFTFKDQQIRSWLRDVGSVLELYVWRECTLSGFFGDVVTSAVVDWEGVHARDGVTNEIDVMAMRGIMPVFISCKTCAVTTEALNELSILRDRFGGKGAKAAIVTAERCRSVTRHRASELGIDVYDLDDLKANSIRERIDSMLKAEK